MICIFLIFIFDKDNKNIQIAQFKFICYLFVYKKIKWNMRVKLKCCTFAHIYELPASDGQRSGTMKRKIEN